jgi:hypothetical protein
MGLNWGGGAGGAADAFVKDLEEISVLLGQIVRRVAYDHAVKVKNTFYRNLILPLENTFYRKQILPLENTFYRKHIHSHPRARAHTHIPVRRVAYDHAVKVECVFYRMCSV